MILNLTGQKDTCKTETDNSELVFSDSEIKVSAKNKKIYI